MRLRKVIGVTGEFLKWQNRNPHKGLVIPGKLGSLGGATTDSNGGFRVRHATLLEAVYQQRAATLHRCAALADAQWDLACPVPQGPAAGPAVRRVRDLVAHLITVDEQLLRGGVLGAWAGRGTADDAHSWDLSGAAMPTGDLLALLARMGERFATLATAAPALVGRMRAPGAFGRQSLWQLVARRVTHEWLHEQDIAAAGDTPVAPVAPPSRVVADVVAETVLCDLPAVALPQAAVTAGVVRLVIAVTPRDVGATLPPIVWGVDFGRRQYGPRVVAQPDAVVRTDAVALALVASGRRRLGWHDPAWAVTGDRDLAAALLETVGPSRAPVEAGRPPLAGVC